MTIVPEIGKMDLAVGGAAAALARLMEPIDVAAQEALAAQVLGALRRTVKRPLDQRRLMMTVRLAEMQALLAMLRTFRAAETAQRDLDGDSDDDLDLDWLLAAERSLEAHVQGEPLMATNPPGPSAGWMDTVDDKDGTGPAQDIAELRRRAEAVALADLQLALAPEPIPRRLIHHLTCAACAQAMGWFEAFSMFLGWQLHAKPHLIEPMLGIDSARPGRETRQRLTTAFETARDLAAELERRLDTAWTSQRAGGAASCPSMVGVDEFDIMVGALASTLEAPEAPLAMITRRLQQSRLPPSRLGRAVRRHAMVLAAVHKRWRRPDWAALAPAHEALCAGRLADAAQWAHIHIADSVRGLAERADLEFLAGGYIAASDLCSRALEASAAATSHERLSLQLRLAEAATFEYLTTEAAEVKPVAALATAAAQQSASASDVTAQRLLAAHLAAELAVVSSGAERAPSRKAAIAILDTALGDLTLTDASPERIDAEMLRIALIGELATLDGAARPQHYDAAEKAAKALAAVDLSSLPAWARDLATAAIGRGMLRPPWANASDAALRKGQEMAERAMASGFAKLDPHFAGVLSLRIGEAHLQLAKGAAAKARNEAAVLWFGRAADRQDFALNERIAVYQRMRHCLVALAKGQQEEWRLCQALAALNRADAICPRDKPNWDLGSIALQRAQVWARLRARSKDRGELRAAVADADAAAEIFRQVKSPGNVFNALRAKANALLECARDERDPDLAANAEAAFATIVAERKPLKISDRDMCQVFMSHGEAANLRGTLLAEPAARAGGREAAREAYREALRLADTLNLPVKSKCEEALKKLDAA